MQVARPKPTLTSEAALKAVEAAVACGRRRGAAIVAAAVDSGGDLMALWRADGAFSASVGIARDKAYTAAVFGLSTDQLSGALLANPVLHAGIAARPGVVLFGGGLPIKDDGEVVGAIGVSGGSEDDDRACAEAGAGALKSGIR